MIPDIIKIRARQLRQEQTQAETILWMNMRRKTGILKVYRQKPIEISKEYNGSSRYIIADFYFPQGKLIVEIDGNIHEKEEVFVLDREKEKLLKKGGFQILRFSNQEIYENPQKILNTIVAFLSSVEERKIKG